VKRTLEFSKADLETDISLPWCLQALVPEYPYKDVHKGEMLKSLIYNDIVSA
jgi:hypothetical protein